MYIKNSQITLIDDRVPESQSVPNPFGGFYFCLLPGFNAAFVSISKNGCTFLKKLAVYFRTDTIIDPAYHGHSIVRKDNYLIPVSKMPQYEKEYGRLLKFAVWRDPVERLISTYRYYCLERNWLPYLQYFDLYNNSSFDHFMEFVAFEFAKKNPEFMDQHLCRQSDYFQPSDVDYIVPIRKLNRFLTEHDIPLIEDRTNSTKVKFEFDAAKWEKRIKELYEADYALPVNY